MHEFYAVCKLFPFVLVHSTCPTNRVKCMDLGVRQLELQRIQTDVKQIIYTWRLSLHSCKIGVIVLV